MDFWVNAIPIHINFNEINIPIIYNLTLKHIQGGYFLQYSGNLRSKTPTREL